MFRLFRRHATITDPETLRDALFSAMERDDEKEFMRLCSDNRRLVVDSFELWQKVPAAILDRPQEVTVYVTRLLKIAQYFMSIGEPALLAHLIGNRDDTPADRWRETMSEAHARAVAGDYSQSKDLLLGVLSEMESHEGNAIDQYRSRVYGLLGTNYFSLRDLPNARKYTALALEECRRTADDEGSRTYTENMFLFNSGTEDGDREVATPPVFRFRKEIALAQDLSDEARYDESNDVLEAVLREMEALPAGSQASFRGKLYGLLGLNSFRLRRMADAARYTELALKHCTDDGDQAGVRIYRANIAVIARAQE
ncbi:hypothetical protein LuPra_04071 [Luteitalea pratensis]|uniref:Uncharacterized protein n=1 Tax=Luteitalea pratensis TaxID=1855912 RepID=A0A143PRR3_LUTPR|nr:hypothetical protein [Luteitalea pratensis]AMY10828.1 hypothetical protein LuPra_04071 [Luteitalea pratensis]